MGKNLNLLMIQTERWFPWSGQLYIYSRRWWEQRYSFLCHHLFDNSSHCQVEFQTSKSQTLHIVRCTSLTRALISDCNDWRHIIGPSDPFYIFIGVSYFVCLFVGRNMPKLLCQFFFTKFREERWHMSRGRNRVVACDVCASWTAGERSSEFEGG